MSGAAGIPAVHRGEEVNPFAKPQAASPRHPEVQLCLQLNYVQLTRLRGKGKG
jgi:hypothetical protein